MQQAVSLLGLSVMMALAWLVSSNRRRVNLRIIGGGLLLQFSLAIFILWSRPGRWLFELLKDAVNRILGFVEAGASFMFGVESQVEEGARSLQLLSSFAFGVLPTIVFFSSLMAILYHIGVMQWIVQGMAWLMQVMLGVSGAESLSAAANVFVGHTEAPLVIRPYIPTMTMSELNAVMIGGFATISGGLLAAYARMNIDTGHLLTASVISAPAALMVAKIMVPETEQPETLGTVKIAVERKTVNMLDAAATGASDGMKLALNVAAMLVAFLALIAMADAILGWIGTLVGFADESGQPQWTLAKGLGYVFAPLAWLMGIETRDCLPAGQLLGIKMVANEFVAYAQLSDWIKADSAVEISKRSEYILTYALSGFSNFGAIGIQIGGIGGIAPNRRSDLARLGLRAMFGGMLACCMTACVAGILL